MSHNEAQDPLAGMERIPSDDPELGTPVNLDGREQYSLYEVAMLYAGRQPSLGGVFGCDPAGAWARVNLHPRSRDICDELIEAVRTRELRASVRREYRGGPLDILHSTIAKEALIRWFDEIKEQPQFLVATTASITSKRTPVSPPQPDRQVGDSECPAGPVSATHSTKSKRRDGLSPVIEQAQGRCVDPLDWIAVWNELLVLTAKGVSPLMGITDEGIKYLAPTTEEGVGYLTRPALRMRISRQRDAR